MVPDVIGILHSSASFHSADKIICLQLQALSSHISHVAEHLSSLSLCDSSREAFVQMMESQKPRTFLCWNSSSRKMRQQIISENKMKDTFS